MKSRVVVGGVNVMKDIEGSLHVTRSWLVGVGRKEGMGRGEIGASSRRQPTDATNEALIGLFTSELRR